MPHKLKASLALKYKMHVDVWQNQYNIVKAKKKKKRCIFIIRDWNAKVESQEIPGVTSKFGLGVQKKQDKV